VQRKIRRGKENGGKEDEKFHSGARPIGLPSSAKGENFVLGDFSHGTLAPCFR
jgi:hypothetical protein